MSNTFDSPHVPSAAESDSSPPQTLQSPRRPLAPNLQIAANSPRKRQTYLSPIVTEFDAGNEQQKTFLQGLDEFIVSARDENNELSSQISRALADKAIEFVESDNDIDALNVMNEITQSFNLSALSELHALDINDDEMVTLCDVGDEIIADSPDVSIQSARLVLIDHKPQTANTGRSFQISASALFPEKLSLTSQTAALFMYLITIHTHFFLQLFSMVCQVAIEAGISVIRISLNILDSTRDISRRVLGPLSRLFYSLGVALAALLFGPPRDLLDSGISVSKQVWTETVVSGRKYSDEVFVVLREYIQCIGRLAVVDGLLSDARRSFLWTSPLPSSSDSSSAFEVPLTPSPTSSSSTFPSDTPANTTTLLTDLRKACAAITTHIKTETKHLVSSTRIMLSNSYRAFFDDVREMYRGHDDDDDVADNSNGGGALNVVVVKQVESDDVY